MTDENTTPKAMLSDGTYNFLKKLVMIVFPEAASLYFVSSHVWELPATEQVLGTFALMTTFLGILLTMASRVYNASDAKYDGQMLVSIGQNGSKTYLLELKDDPEPLDQKKVVSFKVIPPEEIPDEVSTQAS